jgi:hypothetical protein
VVVVTVTHARVWLWPPLEYNQGADIERAAHDGMTAVLAAARNGRMRVLKLLQSKKARMDGVTAEGCATPRCATLIDDG